MKINTLNVMYAMLTGKNQDVLTEANIEDARDNVVQEYEKHAYDIEMRKAVYRDAHDVIMQVLREQTAPITSRQLYELCADRLPEEFTKPKLIYALTWEWQDEINVNREVSPQLISAKA